MKGMQKNVMQAVSYFVDICFFAYKRRYTTVQLVEILRTELFLEACK